MILKKVDASNYIEAINTQKSIFPPYEDGTIEILASVDQKLLTKVTGISYPEESSTYYLAYNDNEIVGIAGLYHEKSSCDDSIWLGWFGVVPKFRGLGFGEKILELTMDKAKEKGFKIIRLYTDTIENKAAVKLYEKLAFTKEEYKAEKNINNCYIYSKHLYNQQVELWNDKNLDLENMAKLENLDKLKLKKIITDFGRILE